MLKLFIKYAPWLALGLMLRSVSAGEVQVAVAANFAAPMRVIAAEFEQATGHKAVLAFGSTGKFYAQIHHGAPFEVFLAADETTPAKLETEGATQRGSRFTYAVGRLVLWSPDTKLVDAQGAVLGQDKFQHLAIAAPRLAPYGAAAIETLARLGLLEQVRSRFVQGENIAQTYQFVASGNAELGFVALSQVYRDGVLIGGSGWVVPSHLYHPIRQTAVLLTRGSHNPAAVALLEFLQSAKAKAVIEQYGYALPDAAVPE